MTQEILEWVHEKKIRNGKLVLRGCPLIDSGMVYEFNSKFTLITFDSECFEADLSLTHFSVDGRGIFIRVEGEIPCEPPFFLLSDNSWKIRYAGPIEVNDYSDNFYKRVLKPRHPYSRGLFQSNPMILFLREDNGFDAVLFSKEEIRSNSGEYYHLTRPNCKFADITLLNFIPASDSEVKAT